MEFDELAEDRSDEMYRAWVRRFASQEWQQKLSALVAVFRPESDTPHKSTKYLHGAFNVCLVFQYENKNFDTIIRFPKPGRVRFPAEKVQKEIAVMRYVQKHTSIPVPNILSHGECELGPYIIMQYVHGSKLSMTLQTSEENPQLDPDIDVVNLKKAYRIMADITVQLSQLRLSRIGSISDDGQVNKGRPLTDDMVFLAEVGNVPPMIRPDQTFASSREYFNTLAAQHLHHLETQRHGFFKDEADCRRRYIARCLFQKIINSPHIQELLDPDPDLDLVHNGINGSKDERLQFQLACDDLRPANVLVDENLQLQAVIDWEFSYAGPAAYAHVPPWWILLRRPEHYQPDLTSFETDFRPRFDLFIEILAEAESEFESKSEVSVTMTQKKLQSLAINKEDTPQKHQPVQRASELMKKDMERNLELFWIIYAARNSYAFDQIYWTFIHHRYLHTDREEDLLDMLDEEQRENLPGLVRRKLEEEKLSDLAEWVDL